MKKVEIFKTKTAMIVIILLIIILLFAVSLYIEKNYQKEYEEIPEISVYYKNKKLAQMLPLTYKWTYNGETKEKIFEGESKRQGEFTISNPYKQYEEYDVPEENTIIISNKKNYDYVQKMNERHKMIENSYTFKTLEIKKTAYRGQTSYGSSRTFDDSKAFLNGIPLSNSYSLEVGEYLYLETINYLKQGKVDYCLKVIAFDEDEARIAKDYRNTPLDNTEKIKELASKIKFGSYLNSIKVDGTNLILEYNWHIRSDSLKMNNLILFACIPDIETITYSPTNKKTSLINKDTGKLEKGEIESVVYTKEEVDRESLANIENLKKFMEQI